jgi:hypothetical protein
MGKTRSFITRKVIMRRGKTWGRVFFISLWHFSLKSHWDIFSHRTHLSLGLGIRDTWNALGTENRGKFPLLLVIMRYLLLMEMEIVQMALDSHKKGSNVCKCAFPPSQINIILKNIIFHFR